MRFSNSVARSTSCQSEYVACRTTPLARSITPASPTPTPYTGLAFALSFLTTADTVRTTVAASSVETDAVTRPTIPALRSVSTAITRVSVTLIPITYPASGFSPSNTGRRPPPDDAVSRSSITPEPISSPTISDTVGRLSPVRLASSVRDTSPPRSSPSTSDELISRISSLLPTRTGCTCPTPLTKVTEGSPPDANPAPRTRSTVRAERQEVLLLAAHLTPEQTGYGQRTAGHLLFFGTRTLDSPCSRP
jgi:hypothetical protein